jgi:hypothetical protein
MAAAGIVGSSSFHPTLAVMVSIFGRSHWTKPLVLPAADKNDAASIFPLGKIDETKESQWELLKYNCFGAS